MSLAVEPLFLVEPRPSTTMGAGQTIQAFATLQSSTSDAHPSYLDPGLITWSSSQPEFASVDARGAIRGLSSGSTTVTAQYQTLSAQLEIRVSGEFVARSIAVGAQGTRSYAIHVPSFEAENGARAAILSLHGGGGSAMIQASTSQLNELADEQQIYIVYLEGSGLIRTFNAGNCCGFAQSQGIDDVGYVGAVLQDVLDTFDIDPARVYATGFSNGGMMSHRLACALSDRIAGVAAIGGASGQFDRSLNQYYSCNPARRIPVLHVHATNDRNYPYEGGVGEGLSDTDFYSIDATIADWISRNNVSAEATIEPVTAITTCYRYAVPADTSVSSAPVVLCSVDPADNYDAVNRIVFGGGHSWPGGVRSPAANSDVPIADFDANAFMWEFFDQQNRRSTDLLRIRSNQHRLLDAYPNWPCR
ncbi:MAG TPA: PHB depolymerase family esterase, partial [Candidatus Synoicihabitans sp.]|nr:PHB depolymerase family esterase [Candidatus Synoicihabitans sp.]